MTRFFKLSVLYLLLFAAIVYQSHAPSQNGGAKVVFAYQDF